LALQRLNSENGGGVINQNKDPGNFEKAPWETLENSGNIFNPDHWTPWKGSAENFVNVLCLIWNNGNLDFVVVFAAQQPAKTQTARGPGQLVNGDLSSHSSLASTGTTHNPALSSGKKRKRNTWCKGYIVKKKKRFLPSEESPDKHKSPEAVSPVIWACLKAAFFIIPRLPSNSETTLVWNPFLESCPNFFCWVQRSH